MGRKPRHPCSLLWENYKSRRALSRGSNLEPPASHHVGHLFGNYVGHHVGHHVHLHVGYHWVKTCPTSQRTAKRVLGVGWKVVYNRILFMTWPLLPLTSYRACWGLFVWPRGEGSTCRNRRRTCLDNHAQRQCLDQPHYRAVSGQSQYVQPHKPGRGQLYPNLCSTWSSFHSWNSRSSSHACTSGSTWVCLTAAGREPHWGFRPTQGGGEGSSWNIQGCPPWCLGLG